MASSSRANATMTIALVLIVLVAIAQLANAKVTYHHYHSELPSRFYFLDNFCYDNWGDEYPGVVEWKVKQGATPTNLQNVYIAFYDNEASSWPKVRY